MHNLRLDHLLPSFVDYGTWAIASGARKREEPGTGVFQIEVAGARSEREGDIGVEAGMYLCKGIPGGSGGLYDSDS